MTLLRTFVDRSFVASSGAAALVAVLLASSASADGVHAGDISLTIANSRIATNVLDGDDEVPQRVFAAELGEFGIPGVGDEPGFDNAAGTFQPGSLISFTIASPLKVWSDGAFTETAADANNGVRMKLSFDELAATSGDAPVDGFALAVAPNGEWHVHYIFELLPATGAFEVESGAYLLELVLHTTQEGIASSQPFWIVFNHELDGETFDEIVEEAEEALGCRADLNGDGVVDGADLAILLGNWAGDGTGNGADINEDGVVDGADLAIVLGNWGPC